MFNKLIATALFSAAVVSAHAAPVKGVGQNLYVYSTGDVSLTYLGASASAEDVLKFGGTTIFDNKKTAIGATFDLGTFSAGTLLNFSLLNKSSQFQFYTGTGKNNPQDGTAHAAASFNQKTHTASVGFEDLLFGGDRDYNDLIFRVSNVSSAAPCLPVPEADSWLMMMAGLALTTFAVRRKKMMSGK